MLYCHLCGHRQPVFSACPCCGGQMSAVGSGTQRVEEALVSLLKRRCKSLRVLRLDSDVTTTQPLETCRDDIENGRINLLIGTQMIAKGYNFPHLACIGVLGSDAGLVRGDFRAEERLFATLSQVIGRGTRNRHGCNILIQTSSPDHPFYRELLADDVGSCWQRLLAARKRALLPPFSHLVLLRAKSKSVDEVEQFMHQLSRSVRQHVPASVRVFDPVPPPIERLDHWHRRQILLLSERRRDLHSFLTCWLPTVSSTSCHFTVEVDPALV